MQGETRRIGPQAPPRDTFVSTCSCAALVEAGERFAGPSLVAVNAAIGIMWRIGSLAGGPATGAAMDATGPAALPVMFTLLFGALALAAWLRSRGARMTPHRLIENTRYAGDSLSSILTRTFSRSLIENIQLQAVRPVD